MLVPPFPMGDFKGGGLLARDNENYSYSHFKLRGECPSQPCGRILVNRAAYLSGLGRSTLSAPA